MIRDLADDNALLREALEYAARGWPVHPCAGKAATKRDWPTRATTDAKTIQQWWTETPAANVGIVTGERSGIWVLDLDGPTGLSDLATLETSHGTLPATWIVCTPSGGRHYYFTMPSGANLRNRTKINGMSIDVRGTGGYVVAPPSRTTTGGYTVAAVHAIADAPPWLLDLVVPTKPSAGSKSSLQPIIDTTLTGQRVDRARAYLASVNPAVQGEGGSNVTFWAARVLVRGFMLDRATARGLMHEYSVRCSPPWSEKEIEHKLDDAETKPFDKPLGWLLDAPRPERRPPMKPDADDRIPRITISTHEHQVNAEARKALAADPDLYQRGGMLVRVVATVTDTPTDEAIRVVAGTPEIVPLKRSLTREKLTQFAVWQREKVRGEDVDLVPAHPPRWTVDAVHECGDWPDIRHLDAMTGYPIMLPSGTVATDGYHDSCRLLVRMPRDLDIAVPDRPTPGDVGDAVRLLLDVVCDFPFADEIHKSAWLAALLTPLAWQMFNGPAPLYLINKNVRGAGAGLLGDTISLIVFGHPFATAVYTNNTEELAKTVTAIAMAGHPAVMFDNLSGKFGNAVLDQALTSSRWDGRILGESRHYRGPLNVVWFGTGNNVQLGADTPRRILPIRLETAEERPELRTGYRHADLRAHVRAHRGRLLSAALTILRAWHVAGRPTHGLPPWGSYEGWSGVVREAIVHAGLPDPSLTRDAMMDTADTDAANMRTILSNWHHLDPTGHGVTAADIVLRAKSVSLDLDPPEWIADIRDAIEDLCGRLDSRSLGYKFRQFARRNFGGLMLDKADPDRKNANRWTARPVGGRTSAGDQKPSPASPKRRNSSSLVQLCETPGTDAGDAGDVPGQLGFDLSFTSNPVRGIVDLDRKAVAQ